MTLQASWERQPDSLSVKAKPALESAIHGPEYRRHVQDVSFSLMVLLNLCPKAFLPAENLPVSTEQEGCLA